MDGVWLVTRGGDKGETSLGDGERVPKDSPRVETYGTLDECQAALGLARSLCPFDDLGQEILRLEDHLGSVMGYFAAYPGMEEPDVTLLDGVVERVRGVVGDSFSFVRPGDSAPGAALHLARTVARRAERSAVKLYRMNQLSDQAYAYINRLSDAIYALSLWADKASKDRTAPSSK
ncbi:MAG TPA: cob(I)yrinic acid a,c-diamide adenosyltransferase [Synergistaceae bacterium]|nr:cob(I)yrinic acid a,c-diamide adenosyltransferase [Synergistaceae bacterium]HQH77547.1 cob(I)yrinic acid a,c-diamide adenosyltransferase [Synergistaceae bacterium]HQK24579.1 cob(I)yrinic acid a,c-diamide adenosyltransferase [Synergistaceae bacterium]